MAAKGKDPQSSKPIVLWRRAALAAMRGKARPLAIIAVLPVALDANLTSHASNEWFISETSMDLRSVQYGLVHLQKAGLIRIDIHGPKRIITAIIPSECATQKHEQFVHASSRAEGERNVHARPDGEGERFAPKARTSRSPIEGRSSPKPPKLSLSEFHRSKSLAVKREAEPWLRGTEPSWMLDDLPAVDDANRALSQGGGGSSRPAAEPALTHHQRRSTT